MGFHQELQQFVCFFSILAYNVKQDELASFLLLSSIILGFWIINVLFGKIFLGDSGAYILGILIGWGGVKIVQTSSTISPWSIFLIIIYPASELVFSILRRIYYKISTTTADNKHLHSILYKFLKLKFPKIKQIYISSITGTILLSFTILSSIAALVFNGDFVNTMLLTIIFIILYLTSYFLTQKFNYD